MPRVKAHLRRKRAVRNLEILKRRVNAQQASLYSGNSPLQGLAEENTTAGLEQCVAFSEDSIERQLCGLVIRPDNMNGWDSRAGDQGPLHAPERTQSYDWSFSNVQNSRSTHPRYSAYVSPFEAVTQASTPGRSYLAHYPPLASTPAYSPLDHVNSFTHFDTAHHHLPPYSVPTTNPPPFRITNSFDPSRYFASSPYKRGQSPYTPHTQNANDEHQHEDLDGVSTGCCDGFEETDIQDVMREDDWESAFKKTGGEDVTKAVEMGLVKKIYLVWRDEWECDFCGPECLCWTVGYD